jgi:hypothetical protein
MITARLASLLAFAAVQTFDHSSREPVADFANRILPEGAELATRPVEVDLPPLGKVVVVVFVPASSSGNLHTNYQGWILVPGSDGHTYRKETLPPLPNRDGQFEYSVKSVFTADADGDERPELCILSSLYENGSGKDAFYMTDVFKWSGKGFEHADDATDQLLLDLKNAKAVRARLKSRLQHGGATRPPPSKQP